MRMSFQGAPDIQADRATVWRSLLDPNFVARAAPAIESVETVDDTHFKVVAGLGVGALKLRFTMKAELFDIVDGESAKTSFRLEDGGPGVIRLHWQADSDVGGTIASVGARLLEGTARRLTEEFWQDFANQVSSEAAG